MITNRHPLQSPLGDHAKMLASGRWKEAAQGYLAAVSYCDAEIGRLKEKVGDLTMATELLGAIGLRPIPRRDVSGADRIERLETARPLAHRRSRR